MKHESSNAVAIVDKEGLHQVLGDLQGPKEILVSIPGITTSDVLEILRGYGLHYSRVGFKRWLVHREQVSETDHAAWTIILRLLGLLSMIAWLFFGVYLILSAYWEGLESRFKSLPLASGIISSGILAVVIFLAGVISRRRPLKILKLYMGMRHGRD